MRLRNSKGSITIEAAIIVPIFICVIMSITLIIRIVYIHDLMQHALNETAQEISTYSYIYSVSGIQKAHDNANNELDDNKASFEEYFSQAVEAYKAVNIGWEEGSDSIEAISSDDIILIKERLGILKDSADISREELIKVTEMLEEIFKDPEKAFISMAYFIGDGSFELFKTKLISEPIAGILVKKYLDQEGMDTDSRLMSLSIADGIKGLDFSQSKLFEDNQTVDIVVRYRIKNILPIKIIPDINLIQRSAAKAWLDGEDGTDTDAENTEFSVWDLTPLKRGVRIQQELGRNLPDRFPVIAKFEQGTAVMIKSIDLEGATYHKPSNLKTTVKSFISELAQFKGGSYMDTQIREADIKYRKLVIVVPEGSITPEQQKVINECIRTSGKDVNIEIKEYGKKSTKKQEE